MILINQLFALSKWKAARYYTRRFLLLITASTWQTSCSATACVDEYARILDSKRLARRSRFFGLFLFMDWLLKMVDDADDQIFSSLINTVEIEIKIKVDLGGQIENDIKPENNQTENEGKYGDSHRPVGETGSLLPPSSGGSENTEQGEKDAEKSGIAAENSNDGHDSCGQ